MTKQELKDFYSELLFLKSISKKKNSGKRLKKEIRNHYKVADLTKLDIHFSEDGESCWYKKFYDFSFKEEEKEQFIEDNWKYVNSQYDCTGKWFSTSIKVCNINKEKSVVYFFYGLDV